MKRSFVTHIYYGLTKFLESKVLRRVNRGTLLSVKVFGQQTIHPERPGDQTPTFVFVV